MTKSFIALLRNFFRGGMEWVSGMGEGEGYGK